MDQWGLLLEVLVNLLRLGMISWLWTNRPMGQLLQAEGCSQMMMEGPVEYQISERYALG